jgi:ribonuclease P protein subunit POP4
LRHTPRNLKYHELVGLRVEVIRHLDPSIEGLSGRVVWETRRALLVEAEGRRGRVLILKSGALLAFHLPGGKRVIVPGDELLGTPVDRLKAVRRR